MAFLYPWLIASRLQIYYDTRLLKGTVAVDAGVETRDVLKALQQFGAVPEEDWPYDTLKFTDAPPQPIFNHAFKLTSYSRLVSEAEYLQCLASGYPFLLGIEIYESFDSAEFAKTGIMPVPDPSKEQLIGGHDVLVVGYDIFKEALLCRNSWGIEWGIAGHCWLPISYAIDPRTGGDAWTGRIAQPSIATKPIVPTVAGVTIRGHFVPQQGERTMSATPLNAKLAAVRAAIKTTVSKFTYMGINVGSHVTDEELDQLAVAAVNAQDSAQDKHAADAARALAGKPLVGPAPLRAADGTVPKQAPNQGKPVS